jgi:hypothetical protein
LDALGQATLTVPGVTADQDVVLVSVSDATCTNPVTGNASVVINSLLSASVSSTTPICSGEDAVFTFTGPANGTIDYTLNGVAATISLDGSGQATLTVPGATADQDVVLTNVSDATCSNPVTENATVVVNPIPATSPIFHD